jgi:hypothetical protein
MNGFKNNNTKKRKTRKETIGRIRGRRGGEGGRRRHEKLTFERSERVKDAQNQRPYFLDFLSSSWSFKMGNSSAASLILPLLLVLPFHLFLNPSVLLFLTPCPSHRSHENVLQQENESERENEYHLKGTLLFFVLPFSLFPAFEMNVPFTFSGNKVFSSLPSSLLTTDFDVTTGR